MTLHCHHWSSLGKPCHILWLFCNNLNNKHNINMNEKLKSAKEISCLGFPMSVTVEDTNELIIGIAVHCFISITATLGNLMVLVTIWRNSRLRSPSTTLLQSLALSDPCVGLIGEPVYVGLKIVRLKSHLSQLCTPMNTTVILSTFLVGVTLFTLTAISADRFLAIYLHLRYQQVVTETRANTVVVSLWMASGLQSLAWMVGINAFILVSLSSGAVCLQLVSCLDQNLSSSNPRSVCSTTLQHGQI